MESLNNSISYASRVYSGEEVVCPTCEIGIMRPVNKNVPIKDNHCFICDNCGEALNIDPVITSD